MSTQTFSDHFEPSEVKHRAIKLGFCLDFVVYLIQTAKCAKVVGEVFDIL